MANKVFTFFAKFNTEQAKADLEKAKGELEQNPVEIDVKVVTEGSIAQLKQLKKQLKDTAAGSEEFKKIFGQIDDLEDKIKSANKTSSDWVDTLENSGGVLGAVGKGINGAKVQFSTFNGALKGSVIGIIVTLLGGLVGAFKDNDAAMKKLQPIMIGIEKIFGGIFKAVEPLFDIFLDLANKALPIVTDAIGEAYSIVSALAESFGTIGKAIGKLFSGDLKGAWAIAKTSVTDFSKHHDEAKDRYIAGTKEMTNTEKEEAEKRKELAEKEQAKREALQKKREAEEEKARQKRIAAQKEEQDRIRGFGEEAMAKETAIQKEIEKARLGNIAAGQTDAQNKIDEENKKYATLIQSAKAFGLSTEELEIQHLNNLNQIRLDADTKQKEIDAKTLETKKKSDETDAKNLEDKTKKEKELHDGKIKLANESLDKIGEIAGKETAVGKAVLIAKQAILAQELILSIKSTLNAAKDSATKATLKGAEAGVDVAAGAAKTAGAAPFPANIPLIVGYAATALSIMLSVKSAISKAKGSTSGVDSTASSIASTSTTPKVNLFGSSNNANNVTGNNTPIPTNQNFIVKAVVSETEITNSQAFINKVKNSAAI